MDTEHSVASHLRLDTHDYDRIIRTYIPHYDESRQVQLELLAAAKIPADARIVDLGGGTGSLAESILERFPEASIVVRDIDPEMLAVAARRLARFAGRVDLDFHSFAEPLPRAHAVLSAFALHHVPNLQQKTDVYRRIFQALQSPAVFLNADAVSGSFWPLLRDQWAAFMEVQGFTREQAYRNLESWAAEDTYFSAYDELCAMADAGFERPECFWRLGSVAVLGARL